MTKHGAAVNGVSDAYENAREDAMTMPTWWLRWRTAQSEPTRLATMWTPSARCMSMQATV